MIARHFQHWGCVKWSDVYKIKLDNNLILARLVQIIFLVINLSTHWHMEFHTPTKKSLIFHPTLLYH